MELDPTRVGRDAGQIAQEVVAHLVALADADVTVTIDIDIEATRPKAATNHPIRPVTHTTRIPNFTPGSGFERHNPTPHPLHPHHTYTGPQTPSPSFSCRTHSCHEPPTRQSRPAHPHAHHPRATAVPSRDTH